jgi:hypothetical protein
MGDNLKVTEPTPSPAASDTPSGDAVETRSQLTADEMLAMLDDLRSEVRKVMAAADDWHDKITEAGVSAPPRWVVVEENEWREARNVLRAVRELGLLS